MADDEPSASVEETTQKALEQRRLSIDDDTKELHNGTLTNGINGKGTPSPRHSGELEPDRIIQLQKELEKTRQEKEALATQYQNLVTRLNNMRTTLGNKLKQDAVRAVSLPRCGMCAECSYAIGGAGSSGTAHTTADCSER